MLDFEEMLQKGRSFLKAYDYDSVPTEVDWEPHQRKGIDPPPRQKSYPEDAILIDLVNPKEFKVGNIPLLKAINHRMSHRRFTDEFLSLEELSFLLWTTQGVREVDKKGVWTKRTVPSGGARQPFVTYLIINRVKGLEPGVYRFLPIDFKLILISKADSNLPERVGKACFGQSFVGQSAIVFVWATIPYRTEWRYSLVGHKDIAIEAGHVCQNLYLACEAINAGTCAIAAYDQKPMDEIIGVDGIDEFTVYLAPVGKVSENED